MMPKGRVFIIEDDADVREDLADILREEGYAVDTAANGALALEQLGDGVAPELIVLDLMMPVMDGWQFRAHQLTLPHLAHLPVIVMSGAADLKEQTAALGANAFVKKPLKIQDFLAVIERHLGGGRLART